jgi:arginine decarboxylase
MVNCVLSEITSDNPGDEITAVIGLAIGEELGCVVETSGINRTPTELIDEAKEMVKYMMDKREVEIKELIIEYSTTKVENIASCISSVVYLNDDIVE